MTFNWGKRVAVAAAVTAPLVLAGQPVASADEPDKDADILLVHGFGSSCSALTDAKEYFEGSRSHDGSVKTVGYYGEGPCDHDLPEADTNTPIQDVAADLADYIDENYSSAKPVNIVAHSMGGLVTRVALLGSGQDWTDFPDGKLPVDNVVTLGTPHQGISDTDKHDDHQWQQMNPDSGFMDRLHADGSELDDDWATGTDWTLVGSEEDGTVNHNSAVDKGNPADKKFGYEDDSDDGGDVTHEGIRTISSGAFSLRYWHEGHPTHHTEDGWAPLKTAYEAATHQDDNLPR